MNPPSRHDGDRGLAKTPPVETPPNIAEAKKWLAYHLVKDWGILTKAPIASGAVIAFSLLLAWMFVWNVIIPEKNEQLATKQSQLEYSGKRLDDALRENERLKSDPERQRLLESLRVLQAENAVLTRENEKLKQEAASEMVVHLAITNSQNKAVQVSPIGSLNIVEHTRNGTAIDSDNPFRITALGSDLVTSPIIISPLSAGEFQFKVARDKQLSFERGVSTLECTVFDFSGNVGAMDSIGFNQGDLRTKKLQFKF